MLIVGKDVGNEKEEIFDVAKWKICSLLSVTFLDLKKTECTQHHILR